MVIPNPIQSSFAFAVLCVLLQPVSLLHNLFINLDNSITNSPKCTDLLHHKRAVANGPAVLAIFACLIFLFNFNQGDDYSKYIDTK